MNAPLRLFAKASFKTSTRGLMLCVCASLSLAGCANYNPLATAPIDPTSPVAEDVARLGRVDAPFPTFADIPPKPTDERPVAAWGKEARQLQTAASALERQTAPNTWTLNGTERFQARALAEAGPANESAASSTAATEAFARQLRERATPPPSPR
jgi:hypothetical protein